MKRPRFSPEIEGKVREHLEKAQKAVEYALAALEVPRDDQDAIGMKVLLEDVVDEAKKAFSAFSDEMCETWPDTNPRAGR